MSWPHLPVVVCIDLTVEGDVEASAGAAGVVTSKPKRVGITTSTIRPAAAPGAASIAASGKQPASGKLPAAKRRRAPAASAASAPVDVYPLAIKSSVELEFDNEDDIGVVHACEGMDPQLLAAPKFVCETVAWKFALRLYTEYVHNVQALEDTNFTMDHTLAGVGRLPIARHIGPLGPIIQELRQTQTFPHKRDRVLMKLFVLCGFYESLPDAWSAAPVLLLLHRIPARMSAAAAAVAAKQKAASFPAAKVLLFKTGEHERNRVKAPIAAMDPDNKHFQFVEVSEGDLHKIKDKLAQKGPFDVVICGASRAEGLPLTAVRADTLVVSIVDGGAAQRPSVGAYVRLRDYTVSSRMFPHGRAHWLGLSQPL